MFTHLMTSTDVTATDRNARRAGGVRHPENGKQRALSRALTDAVETADLSLYYQPRVSLETGLRIGAEATVRWESGKHGRVSPSVFLPLAEANGQITQIGGWTLRAACIEAARWGGLNVAVKVSVRQLEDDVLLGQVATALEASGLAPELLELEFEQSLMADVSIDTLLALSAIRDVGVGVALDDYGSGFATLGMLKRLPLTALKLDRALVRDLQCHADDAAIARAIIQASRALGFIVIADGVETEAQREFLLDAGCDEGQGGLFGQPTPASPPCETAPTDGLAMEVDHGTSKA